MDLPPALWLCGKKGNVTLITVFQKGMLEINVFFSHCSLRLPLRRIHSLPVSEGGIDLA